MAETETKNGAAGGPAARAKSPRLVDSIRALGDGLLAAAQDRLELLSIEVEEEKLRLVRTLVWACAAAFAGMMAVIFLSLLLVGAFWNTARMPVLAGLTVLYAGGFVFSALEVRKRMLRTEHPFKASREEIARDRRRLQPPE